MNKNNKIAIGIILVSLAALSVLSLLGFNGRKQPIEPNDSLSVNSSDNVDDSLTLIPSENISNTEDNSNPSEEPIVNKNGWYQVTNLNELTNGDKVTFVSKDYKKTIDSYNAEVKRFNFVDSQFSENEIVTTGSSGLYFEFGIVENGYTFSTNNQYLTSAYSSSNTCKLTTVLNEYSTFNVSFEDGFAVCKAGGDKNCNTIKYSSTYFSLYTFDSGDFPIMMKWYGNEDPYFKDSFNPSDYEYQIDLSDYTLIEYGVDEFEFEDGMQIIPVYVNEGKYILTSSDSEQSFICSEFLMHENKFYGKNSYKVLDVVQSEYFSGYYKLSSLVLYDAPALLKTTENKITIHNEDDLDDFYDVGFVYREDNSIYEFASSYYIQNVGYEFCSITYILVKKTTE